MACAVNAAFTRNLDLKKKKRKSGINSGPVAGLNSAVQTQARQRMRTEIDVCGEARNHSPFFQLKRMFPKIQYSSSSKWISPVEGKKACASSPVMPSKQ